LATVIGVLIADCQTPILIGEIDLRGRGSYTALPGIGWDWECLMAFSCVVVTPEQQVLDESLTQAIIPAADGLLGILTHRAPLLAKLGKGPLRLDLASGQKKTFRIEGGVAQMIDNKLTILTNMAKDDAKA
jgi:F-type H+-transporting ATPase subunit epsilon